MIGREDEVREYRDRAAFFSQITVLFFILLIARLAYLQLLKGDELRKFSEANRLKKERLYSTRGIIYDREGRIIVDNRASYDVVLFSQYYPFTAELNARLAKALGIPLPELEKKLEKVRRNKTYFSFILKSNVSKDVLAAIEMDAKGFPGIDIEPNVQRRYPQGELAAQVLGYVGEVDSKEMQGGSGQKGLQLGDYIGKMGIERYYDSYLRGANGVGYVEVDAFGRRRKTEGEEKVLGFVSQTDPIPGGNIYLTIDNDLEKVALQALQSRGYSGSVVAMDPRNGEVLAMVNNPSYNPELITGREISSQVWANLRENKDRPLRNRAVQDIYPPGSTFKLIVGIAALAEGKAIRETVHICHGGMAYGNRRFNCWKRHGAIDFVRAIRESCDVFFYSLGLQLGIDTIAKYARMFGLGNRTGIHIPNEQKGIIPDTEWKQKRYNDIWHSGETLSVAIGQGYVTVTPLQLATAYSAIANGGFLYQPYIVRKIESTPLHPGREYQPELIRKIDIAPEIFEVVKEGLFGVVNMSGGTAVGSRSTITTISGKTGTSQVRQFKDIRLIRKCDALERQFRHHALFVGFAPRENPEIVVAAIAEHGCHGAAAARVVKDVMEAYFIKKDPNLLASQKDKVKEKHLREEDE